MTSSQGGGDRTASATAEDLGRSNAATILSCVLTNGPIARAEIATRVGLTRATVTRVTNRLIETGLLVEEPPRRDNPGRPMIPLAVDGSDRATVSVHFGAKESRVGLVDLRGNILVELRDRYPDNDPTHLVETVAGRVSEVLAHHAGSRKILGIGASIGGWVHSDAGVVVRFEPLEWRDVPLGRMLATRTGMPVFLDQFARGLARAERMFGVARDLQDVLLIWLGNVVDAALVHDGDVQRGPDGAVGIITHFPVRGSLDDSCPCGRVGCLGRAVTDDAFLAEAGRRGLVPPEATIRELMHLADVAWTGVPQLVTELAKVTGEAAAAMADLTNPSAVLVAGLLTTTPTFLPAFRSQLVATAVLRDRLEVRQSSFGDLAPTAASAAVLIGQFFADPIGFEQLT